MQAKTPARFLKTGVRQHVPHAQTRRRAAGAPLGTPDRCTVEIRRDGKWVKAADREFSNVKSNPVPQLIPLDNVKTDHIRIRADRFLDGAEEMVFGEMGILLAE